VESVIKVKLAEEDITGARTLLGFLARSVDPETGEKLSYLGLKTNATNIMSALDLFC
jgi:hypothetical protein